MGLVLPLQAVSQIAPPNKTIECCEKAEACVSVLSECHQQYIRLHEYASQQNAFIEQLTSDNKKLAEMYQEASTRAWWERPEIAIPIAIGIGFLGGTWAASK